MKILCYLIIIGLVIISVSSCNTTEPELIDYHDKILFTSSRSGKEQLYMMNPDGTNIRQLTTGQYWHNNGRWSRDASKIVCNTEEGTTTAGTSMVVMNSDGSSRKLLGYGFQMSWHPNGNIILFANAPSLESGISGIFLYTVNTDGSNKSKLQIDGEGGSPDFSPDGEKIIYIEPDYEGSPPNPKTKIISYPDFITILTIDSSRFYPKWSSDGREIAFCIQPNIFCMNADGSNIRQITDMASNMLYIYPNWAPDDEKIIFLSYTMGGTQKWYLYMVNKDGTNLHKVIDDDSVTSCDWSK